MRVTDKKEIARLLKMASKNQRIKAEIPEEKKSKYNSRKVLNDGLWFDSQLESDRYDELKLLQNIGAIKELQLQPRFLLQKGFRDSNGKRHRPIHYKADFQYVDVRAGAVVVEDAKGKKTEAYSIKKKLFLFNYPDLNFKEVKQHGKNAG